MTNAVAQITNSVSPINGLDVVNAVDGFYSSAFSNTCWLLGILLTILGFAIPAVYYGLAKWQIRVREKKLVDQLKKEVDSFRVTLEKQNEEKFKQLEAKFNMEVKHTKAGVFLVQAIAFWGQEEKRNSIKSFANALECLKDTDDLKQLQEQLRATATNVLPSFNKLDFAEDTSTQLAEVIKAIRKIQANGLLENDIEAFNTALVEAQKREPQPNKK